MKHAKKRRKSEETEVTKRMQPRQISPKASGGIFPPGASANVPAKFSSGQRNDIWKRKEGERKG